jgi:hypothetical protein
MAGYGYSGGYGYAGGVGTNAGQSYSTAGQHLANGLIGLHKQLQANRKSANIGDALVHMQLPDPTDPTGKKTIPLFDQKHIDAWDQMSGQSKVANAAAYEAMARMYYAAQQSLQAHIGQAQNNQRVPTQIGQQTFQLSQGQAANIAMAQQPKQLSQEQMFQQKIDLQKMLNQRITESPEFKFQKEHGLLPKQVLFQDPDATPPPNAPPGWTPPGIPDTAQQGYNLMVPLSQGTKLNWSLQGGTTVPDPSKQLVDPKNGVMTQVQPDYDENGVPQVPQWVQQQVNDLNAGKKPDQQVPGFQWQPTGDVYRADVYKGQKGQPEQVVPNPQGETLSINGQNIPYSDVQSINNRHDAVQQDANSALKTGKNPDAVIQLYQGLGYDTSDLQLPPPQ